MSPCRFARACDHRQPHHGASEVRRRQSRGMSGRGPAHSELQRLLTVVSGSPGYAGGNHERTVDNGPAVRCSDGVGRIAPDPVFSAVFFVARPFPACWIRSALRYTSFAAMVVFTNSCQRSHFAVPGDGLSFPAKLAWFQSARTARRSSSVSAHTSRMGPPVIRAPGGGSSVPEEYGRAGSRLQAGAQAAPAVYQCRNVTDTPSGNHDFLDAWMEGVFLHRCQLQRRHRSRKLSDDRGHSTRPCGRWCIRRPETQRRPEASEVA